MLDSTSFAADVTRPERGGVADRGDVAARLALRLVRDAAQYSQSRRVPLDPSVMCLFDGQMAVIDAWLHPDPIVSQGVHNEARFLAARCREIAAR